MSIDSCRKARNRNLDISTAPTKARSREPAYSQLLTQNKIDRQRVRSRESGRQTVRRLWWMVFGVAGGSLFQRGWAAMAMEQSASFIEEVTGRAEEESVVISKAAKEADMYLPLLYDPKNNRHKRQ